MEEVKKLNRKIKKIEFRVTDEDFAIFNDKAKQENKTVSELCRKLLKSYTQK